MSESPHLREQTLERSAGSSQEPEEEPGEGGEAGAAQCLSVAPQRGLENKAQWLHCQQAFSCTFRGLPDTRPLPVFNNQHNNLFRGRSNGLLLDRRPERDHSALNGRRLRLVLSSLLIFFIPVPRLTCYERMGDYRQAVGHFLVPNGLWVELLKTEKTTGVEHIVVHSTRQSAEFSNFWIKGWSDSPFRKKKKGYERKCGMNDSQQRCPSMIH